MLNVALLCFLAVLGETAAAPKPKLAILPFRVVRMPADLAPALNSHLAGAMDARDKYAVITPDDINAMLGFERMKDAVSCTDTACAAEVGGALGVPFLLSAQATVLGGTAEITLTLIDVHQAQVVARKQGRVPNEERFLAQAIDEAVNLLVGPNAQGSADVTTMPLHISNESTQGYDVRVVGEDGAKASCVNAVTRDMPCLLRVPRQTLALTGKPLNGLLRPTVHLNLAESADGYSVQLNGTGSSGLFVLGTTGLTLGLTAMTFSAIAFKLDSATAGFAVLGSGVVVAGLGGYALYVGFPRDATKVTRGVLPAATAGLRGTF